MTLNSTIDWLFVLFFFAVGASVGSFLNVVILRLPEGRSIVFPPSHDVATGIPLQWWENLPILSFLLLRGRSRYTGEPLSLQYPLIEALTATAFAGLYVAYYHTTLSPEWANLGMARTWPVFLIHLVLLASLIAATVVDAKLYIIPLQIPWLVTGLALVALPLTAALMPQTQMVAPQAGPLSVHTALGATAGLAIALTLLWTGLLPRSFEDLESASLADDTDVDVESRAAGPDAAAGEHGAELEAGTRLEAEDESEVQAGLASEPESASPSGASDHHSEFPGGQDQQDDRGEDGPDVAPSAGDDSSEPRTTAPEDGPEQWLAYPHARREMGKEMLFVVWPVVAALLAALFVPEPQAGYPLALRTLGGVAFGYFVGAAWIWLVRILGSLAFGKEAMGLGDVHLLAAIGAVLGAKAATFAFFLAPFFGIGAYLVGSLMGATTGRRFRAIPFGPFLACAAVLVMLASRFVYRLAPSW